MRVVIAGGTGLIGSALGRALVADGASVTLLVRRAATERRDGVTEVQWNPTGRDVPQAALDGADAIVNLAGSPVAEQRTKAQRDRIESSRVAATEALAMTLARMSDGPRVLIQGSAIGRYGPGGETVFVESSPAGHTFLAGVVSRWEAAARPAVEAGIRTVFARTGIVLAAEGGALARLLPLIRLGLGGPLGSGRQWWSWITLRDEVNAIRHAITTDVSGPLNLTAPHPARQRDVVAALARQVRRPARLSVPGWALRLALGGFAAEILASQRVLPAALLDSGFEFTDETIESAAPALMSR